MELYKLSKSTHMSGDEALHGSNFTEEANLVDLSDNSVQHLSFEGSEHDGFVLQSNWLLIIPSPVTGNEQETVPQT